MTPVGSAGDVHPFIGIGRRLQERGHEVIVITNGRFRKLVCRNGLGYLEHGTADEFEHLLEDRNLWHPRRGLGIILQMVGQTMRDLYDLIEEVYEPGHSILVGHTLAFGTRMYQEKHHAPGVTIHLAPCVFRSDFQQPALLPGRDLSGAPRWAKRTAWWVLDRGLIDPHLVPELNGWRRDLGLPRIRRPFRDWIHSPCRTIGLFPPWFGPPQSDWPQSLRLTGFALFDDARDETLRPELEAFFKRSDPPIAWTAGSANRHAAAFFATASAASTHLGRPALFFTRYPQQLPPTLGPAQRHVSYAPFSQVLPRCAAVVHHGGIGTCAQGLAAGIPHLVMPMGFDQHDNAMRLGRLGVGTWLTPHRFRPPNVAAALRSLLEDAQVKEACRLRAGQVDRDRALGPTCDLIEQAASWPDASPVEGPEARSLVEQG